MFYSNFVTSNSYGTLPCQFSSPPVIEQGWHYWDQEQVCWIKARVMGRRGMLLFSCLKYTLSHTQICIWFGNVKLHVYSNQEETLLFCNLV